MQVELLLTEDLPEIPEGIETLFDFEEISIVTDDNGVITGEHFVLEGTPEAFVDWLGGYEIWVGCGTLQLQEFKKREVSKTVREEK